MTRATITRSTPARVGPALGATCALLLLGAAPVQAQKTPTVAELVKQVKPAVVYIATFDARGEQQGLGSGFVVDPGGLVVTNLHVIQGAQALAVKMADGEVYDKVEILDYDARRDIAVLKVRPFSKLPTVPLGDSSSIEIGEEAVAVGNPKGMEHTVSSGLVSAIRQDEGYRLIQISVPISPGSSGGPLFNRQGQVIGITTAQLRGEGVQNLNFAVPVNYVKPLLESKNTPVTVAELNKTLGTTSGTAPGVTPGQNTSGDVDAYATVAHDHVSGDFKDICAGVLYLKGDRIGYATKSGMHDWEMPLEAVKEIKRNALTGVQYQAFHVTLKTGTNYNFAAVTDDGTPVSPDELIFIVMKAVRKQ